MIFEKKIVFYKVM